MNKQTRTGMTERARFEKQAKFLSDQQRLRNLKAAGIRTGGLETRARFMTEGVERQGRIGGGEARARFMTEGVERQGRIRGIQARARYMTEGVERQKIAVNERARFERQRNILRTTTGIRAADTAPRAKIPAPDRPLKGVADTALRAKPAVAPSAPPLSTRGSVPTVRPDRIMLKPKIVSSAAGWREAQQNQRKARAALVKKLLGKFIRKYRNLGRFIKYAKNVRVFGPLVILFTGWEVLSILEDENMPFEQKLTRLIALAAGLVTAGVGAAIGTALGVLAGSAIGGVGALIAGPVGGIAGMGIGFFAGQTGATLLLDWIFSNKSPLDDFGKPSYSHMVRQGNVHAMLESVRQSAESGVDGPLSGTLGKDRLGASGVAIQAATTSTMFTEDDSRFLATGKTRVDRQARDQLMKETGLSEANAEQAWIAAQLVAHEKYRQQAYEKGGFNTVADWEQFIIMLRSGMSDEKLMEKPGVTQEVVDLAKEYVMLSATGDLRRVGVKLNKETKLKEILDVVGTSRDDELRGGIGDDTLGGVSMNDTLGTAQAAATAAVNTTPRVWKSEPGDPESLDTSDIKLGLYEGTAQSRLEDLKQGIDPDRAVNEDAAKLFKKLGGVNHQNATRITELVFEKIAEYRKASKGKDWGFGGTPEGRRNYVKQINHWKRLASRATDMAMKMDPMNISETSGWNPEYLSNIQGWSNRAVQMDRTLANKAGFAQFDLDPKALRAAVKKEAKIRYPHLKDSERGANWQAPGAKEFSGDVKKLYGHVVGEGLTKDTTQINNAARRVSQGTNATAGRVSAPINIVNNNNSPVVSGNGGGGAARLSPPVAAPPSAAPYDSYDVYGFG